MLEITTTIDIDAPPDRVWAQLSDFSAHAAWNPFITKLDGTARVGERLAITLQRPGGKAMSFKPVVLVADRGSELRWLGRFVFPGLVDGEHFFRIEPIDGGRRSRFTHGERFTGLLVPVLRRSVEGPTRQGFEAMNRALKARVEAGQALESPRGAQ
jgi:hypothetical protein